LLINNRLDGIGRFSAETLRRIALAHPEHEFHFIFDRPFDKEFVFSDNVYPYVIPPQARHPLLYLMWFEVSVPLLFRRIKPDLFVSPDGYLSLRTRVPSIAVIHDLNFEHFPKDLPWLVSRYYRRMFPRFAKKALRIATVSEYSKKDIIQRYSVENEKVDVVYNGVSNHFHPISEAEQETTRRSFSSNKPYFLFVGSLNPRKNLKNLFLAFDEFKKNDALGVKLIVAGARMWWTDDMRFTYENMRHHNDVIFTGRVTDTELVKLVASALALTYVSGFEGFGIPILEAFQCKTPVITSNVTSMPEVAGDAALQVNPFDISEITKALHRIATEPEMRIELVRKGEEQCRKFSWDKSSELLWNCIEKAI
jgi:glycosyltransferase involved in cell wall biosynthesis